MYSDSTSVKQASHLSKESFDGFLEVTNWKLHWNRYIQIRIFNIHKFPNI